MRRATAVAGGWGLANAAVAFTLWSLLPRGSEETGWFAYAPLAESMPLRASASHTDRAIVVVPMALVVLNVVLVLLALRKRWLRE